MLPSYSAPRGGIFTRSNGLKFALIWFLVLDFLLVPLIAIMGGDELVAVVAVLGFVGALIIMFLSLLFLPSGETQPVAVSAQAQPELGTFESQGALPPETARPAADVMEWKAPDTGELVAPGSVTEGTTKLLDKTQGSESE